MSASAERMRRLRAGDTPLPGGRPVTAPCGTLSAVRRHRRNHEPLDDLCRAAAAAEQRARRAARRSAQSESFDPDSTGNT